MFIDNDTTRWCIKNANLGKRLQLCNEWQKTTSTVDTTSIKPFLWQPTVEVPQNISEKKTNIEFGTSHLNASFGLFCVQTSQLFEA